MSPTANFVFFAFFLNLPHLRKKKCYSQNMELLIAQKRYDRCFTEDLRPPHFWQTNSNYGLLGCRENSPPPAPQVSPSWDGWRPAPPRVWRKSARAKRLVGLPNGSYVDYVMLQRQNFLFFHLQGNGDKSEIKIGYERAYFCTQHLCKLFCFLNADGVTVDNFFMLWKWNIFYYFCDK